jgi:uncharacterized protein YecT (DUF1311 family)
MHYRLTAALLVALAWPCSAAAQRRAEPECLDTAGTQAAITRCSGEAFKAADRRLQQLVAELRDSLPPPQRVQLDSAQLAWSTYAAVHCRLEASAYEGGSMYPMQVTACRGRLVERRIAELGPLLCDRGAKTGQRCPAAERYMRPARPRASRR